MKAEYYTLVVTPRLLGLYWHVRLVANFRSNLEEMVMHSENYHNKQNAVRAARKLGSNLGIEVYIEEK